MARPVALRAWPDHRRPDSPDTGHRVRTRDAVRVYPTADDMANRAEIRVLDTDPHADAIPWNGSSVTTITKPIDIGPFEDAEPCRVLFLRRQPSLAERPDQARAAGSTGCSATSRHATTRLSGRSISRQEWNSAPRNPLWAAPPPH